MVSAPRWPKLLCFQGKSCRQGEAEELVPETDAEDGVAPAVTDGGATVAMQRR